MIRTVLARIGFLNEDVYKTVSIISGGERVKVALSKLFVSDINTLILDEPTNFLDTAALEALEKLLKEYEGSIIVVSHDRRFVASIAIRILEIRDENIHLFEGTYQEYKESQLQREADAHQDDYLLLETKISEVLSRLSIDPSEALEREFQELMREKREWDK